MVLFHFLFFSQDGREHGIQDSRLVRGAPRSPFGADHGLLPILLLRLYIKAIKVCIIAQVKASTGDIRTIFQQQYLSPRPDTCSVRLGTDGYSTWQSKNAAPKIDLSGVPALLDEHRRLKTPQGVPFNWSGGARNIAFTSQWDNWPRSVTVKVNKSGEALWMLVCGSTNPMQVRIANAALRLRYADGVVETLELTPPFNFWSLCPAVGRFDYDYKRDAFSLPKAPPATVQLGQNCRAVLLNWRLRSGVELESVTLEALSPEVVIGLMGLTLMNGH